MLISIDIFMNMMSVLCCIRCKDGSVNVNMLGSLGVVRQYQVVCSNCKEIYKSYSNERLDPAYKKSPYAYDIFSVRGAIFAGLRIDIQ